MAILQHVNTLKRDEIYIKYFIELCVEVYTNHVYFYLKFQLVYFCFKISNFSLAFVFIPLMAY